MKYFDAHTHINFVAYDEDREETINRCREQGVGMNVVGTQLDTSRSAVALAEKHDHVFATIGLHPIHTAKSYHDPKELDAENPPAGGFTSRGEVFETAVYEALGTSAKVIAVGECGLDYYRVERDTKDVQVKAFIEQIELANRLSKPLMLHIRNAYDDALEVLKAHAKVRGDVHFFAGDWGVAKKFLDEGYALSFTGVITFTHDYDEVVRNTPLDMILSETDAPYVTPVPHRGKRNEPAYVQMVVERIAEIKNQSVEVVQEAILANAERVFQVKLRSV